MIHIEYNQKNVHSFNDRRHRDNFINYMLRTDEKQKWDNVMTPLNCYVTVVNRRANLFVENMDLKARLEMREEVLAEVESIDIDQLKDDEIVIFCGKKDLNDIDYQRIFKATLCTLIKKLGRDFLRHSVAFAMHNDQIESTDDNAAWVMHIHRLFVVK